MRPFSNGVNGACARPNLNVTVFSSGHQPCGSVSRMPSSASRFSMNLIRSFDAVGKGGRVGPTGLPMMTHPPFSDDGYWSRNSIQSCDSLYCADRARSPWPEAQDLDSSMPKVGQTPPADEREPAPPEGHRRQQVFDAGDHCEIRPQRQRRAQDFEEFLAIEAGLFHSDEVRQLVDQPLRQFAGEFDAC